MIFFSQALQRELAIFKTKYDSEHALYDSNKIIYIVLTPPFASWKDYILCEVEYF